MLAKPVSTPVMSLRWSQRLTCTTSRSEAVGRHGSSPIRSRYCRTSPWLPSRRVNGSGPSASTPASSPVRTRMPRTSAGCHLPVLGRERVDRRRDHPERVAVHPLRCIGVAGEDERVGVLDVRSAGMPSPARTTRSARRSRCGSARPRSRRVSRSPSTRPAVCGSCSSTMSPRPDHLSDQLQVGRLDLLVVRRARVRPAGRRHPRAVQPVVQSLGDREELLIAVQHQPAGVDPGAAPVGQQRLQHLGDAATLGGGIDVPHDPAGQQRYAPVRRRRAGARRGRGPTPLRAGRATPA